MKKTIIAICGASASGKDTIANLVYTYLLTNPKNDCGLIVGDTTRPCRTDEIDGINYNFIKSAEFIEKIAQHKFIDYQNFRGWLYGIPLNSVKYDINIGVFNARTMDRLLQMTDKYNIILIYLTASCWTRLKRSCIREGKFKFEFIRRSFSDFSDYIRLVRHFHKKYNITMHKFKTDTDIPNLSSIIARRIINILKYSK